MSKVILPNIIDVAAGLKVERRGLNVDRTYLVLAKNVLILKKNNK